MAKNLAKEQGAMSAAGVFKAIDNVLKKPGCGCSGSLDYMEQSSWLLFLRYLDAREDERKLEARLNGNVYEPALPKRLRWSEWAYPLDAEGKLDYEKMLKGDELLNFVRQQLFPGLKRLRDENLDTNSLQYRIGSIFTEMTCKFTSGYSIREVIDLIQPLRFQTEEDRHELSVLYESRLEGAKAKTDKLEAKAREGVAICETMRKAILKEAFE